MRRRKLSQMVFDKYPQCTQAQKEQAQDMVFEYYYDRNDCELEITLEEIRADIIRLESVEQYERCLMLKDILKRLE